MRGLAEGRRRGRSPGRRRPGPGLFQVGREKKSKARRASALRTELGVDVALLLPWTTSSFPLVSPSLPLSHRAPWSAARHDSSTWTDPELEQAMVQAALTSLPSHLQHFRVRSRTTAARVVRAGLPAPRLHRSNGSRRYDRSPSSLTTSASRGLKTSTRPPRWADCQQGRRDALTTLAAHHLQHPPFLRQLVRLPHSCPRAESGC